MPGTLVIPAGSNLGRYQVVEQLIGSAFDDVSAPDLWFNFEAGSPVNKLVQIVDGDPWQLGSEMLALEGRKLLRDRYGAARYLYDRDAADDSGVSSDSAPAKRTGLVSRHFYLQPNIPVGVTTGRRKK